MLNPDNADEEKDFTCDICNKEFSTLMGLLNHRWQTHQVICPTSLRTYTNQCPHCHSHLGTRCKVLKHIKERMACAYFVLQNITPMSLDEYRSNIHQLNSTSSLHDRLYIPRRGRIGEGVSQHVKPLDFMDEIEATGLACHPESPAALNVPCQLPADPQQ
eukprot:5056699-Amphidinium_carterae.1